MSNEVSDPIAIISHTAAAAQAEHQYYHKHRTSTGSSNSSSPPRLNFNYHRHSLSSGFSVLPPTHPALRKVTSLNTSSTAGSRLHWWNSSPPMARGLQRLVGGAHATLKVAIIDCRGEIEAPLVDELLHGLSEHIHTPTPITHAHPHTRIHPHTNSSIQSLLSVHSSGRALTGIDEQAQCMCPCWWAHGLLEGCDTSSTNTHTRWTHSGDAWVSCAGL